MKTKLETKPITADSPQQDQTKASHTQASHLVSVTTDADLAAAMLSSVPKAFIPIPRVITRVAFIPLKSC
jgi:hypothetical protein